MGSEPCKLERSELVTGTPVEGEGAGDGVGSGVGGGGVWSSGDAQRDEGAGEARAIVISSLSP